MKVTDQDTGREFYLFNSEELGQETSQHWGVKCPHNDKKLGRIKYANGSVHVREVCLDCGEFTGATLKKLAEHDSLPMIEQGKIRDTYNSARKDKYKEILQKHVRIQRNKSAGYQKEYISYLSSEKWKQKRGLVMKRANSICEGCLESGATIVHHLNYNHIYAEMLFDLVALCESCHAQCHPDKNKMTEEEFFGADLPCYGCRLHGHNDEGSWCDKFDVHTVIALTDSNLCGPKASALEPLK